MKEISEKKVQIKQKEKEVKKRMRAVEKNIFKVEKKSMSQIQLQEVCPSVFFVFPGAYFVSLGNEKIQ